ARARSRADLTLNGLRRAIRREARKARAVLTATWPPSDEAVHAARRRGKKARALLRLARAAMGERTYRRANGTLRDAARPLSELRDAVVLVHALDALLARQSG